LVAHTEGESYGRLFENRVLRRILLFGTKRDKMTEENYKTRKFIICTPHPISIG
jgi:hypothetical protein